MLSAEAQFWMQLRNPVLALNLAKISNKTQFHLFVAAFIYLSFPTIMTSVFVNLRLE